VVNLLAKVTDVHIVNFEMAAQFSKSKAWKRKQTSCTLNGRPSFWMGALRREASLSEDRELPPF